MSLFEHFRNPFASGADRNASPVRSWTISVVKSLDLAGFGFCCLRETKSCHRLFSKLVGDRALLRTQNGRILSLTVSDNYESPQKPLCGLHFGQNRFCLVRFLRGFQAYKSRFGCFGTKNHVRQKPHIFLTRCEMYPGRLVYRHGS